MPWNLEQRALTLSDKLQERGRHDLFSWFQPLMTLACIGMSGKLSEAFAAQILRVGVSEAPMLCSHGRRLIHAVVSELEQLVGSTFAWC